MLTGKCKEDFLNWILMKYHCQGNITGNNINLFLKKDVSFFKAPFSMQYGVYVDFFDSVDFEVLACRSSIFEGYHSSVTIKHEAFKAAEWVDNYSTRNEARQKAIETANKLYNESK